MKHLIAVILISMSACGILQNPAGPSYPTTEATHKAMEIPPRDGYEYCQRISGSARVRASRTASWGWTFSILGAGASLSGALIPLSKAGKLDFDAKFGSAALVAGGGILIALGQAILNRSDAASKLAGATASILGETQTLSETQTTGAKREIIIARDAGAKCSIALGAWESSRADATAIASTLLEAEKKEGSDAKAKAFAAQANADKANTDLKNAETEINTLQLQLQENLQETGKPEEPKPAPPPTAKTAPSAVPPATVPGAKPEVH